MIFKFLILGTWIVATVQALPSAPVTVTLSPAEKEKDCDKKLRWYRETTSRTQELFDKYYGEYKRFRKTHNPDDDHIETQHSEFEQKITGALDRYQDDAKKIYNISDESARLAFCIKELDWAKLMDANLTKTATNMKTDVLNILDALGVPKETRDLFDQTLSRIVNFLFIIDMTKNLYKDVNTLFMECFTKTKEGIKLEDKYRIGENGELVETAQEIDEAFNEVIKDDETDKQIEEELNNLENDHDIKVAEEKAEEREEERAREEEERRNGVEEEEGPRGEEPYKLEFTPVVLKAKG